jgi:hypothetical protein
MDFSRLVVVDAFAAANACSIWIGAVAAVTAATTARDSAEVGLLRLRENAAQLHANERPAARARRCAH